MNDHAATRTDASFAEVIASSRGHPAWAGLPIEMRRSAARGSWSETFDRCFLAVVVRGRCEVDIHRGSRHRHVSVLPNQFAMFPVGRHWDRLDYAGVVDTINISLEPDTLPPPARGAALELAALHASATDPAVHALAQCMLAELMAGCPTGPLYSEALGVALSARLQEFAREADGARSAAASYLLAPSKARRVEDFIRLGVDGDLSIARLAALVGMSPSHFANCFRNTFGQPVHRYVLTQRIEASTALLRDGLEPADVALRCGFATQSHFTQTFRKVMGVTPGRYAGLN